MRMKPDFDLFEFFQNVKATKPPYECPFSPCHKVYKSLQGIEGHVQKQHNNGHSRVEDTVFPTTSGGKKNREGGRWPVQERQQCDNRTPSPSEFTRATSTREALTYAEAQKMVEFEVEGKIYRIDINEPLNIVYVDGKNGDMPVLSVNGDVLRRSEASTSHTASCQGSGDNNTNDEPKTSGKGKPTKGKGKKTKPGKFGSKNKKDGNQSSSCLTVSSSDTATTATILKLPEPSFRIIEDYQCKDAPPRKSSYYRHIDKPTDESEDSEEKVEYDMDEEDTAWLELVNKKRKEDGVPEIPADTFEQLMDKLEKESYFQSQNSGKEVGPAIDEDAVCCICNDGECQNSNAILFCDMCNLAVHQECYGVPYIPEGQWLCRRCLQSPSRAVDCVLCPNKGGAFKQTDDNRWAHVVCALWIPEVCFANTVFLEPIDSIHQIPSARWKLSCYICKQRVGACIQCHKPNCYVAFHVTCAQQAGLYMKMDAVKEMTVSGVVTNVRKAAFCDAHTPADENETLGLSGVYSSIEEESKSESKRAKQSREQFKDSLKKTRKILAEKRLAIPVVSIPTMPLERLTCIVNTIKQPKRNQFIQLLLGYWTLKRQSRNGVPLLRRLHVSYSANRKGVEAQKNSDDEYWVKRKEEHKTMQRLRQDLERARLLVELIRKREKVKKEMIALCQKTVESQLNPFKWFLMKVWEQLKVKDEKDKYFAEPVDVKEVSDYLAFIEHPMDFKTMRQKIERNEYECFNAFECDFKLIVSNCMKYNTKETVFHKAALRLSEYGSVVLKEARKQLPDFDEKTGLLVNQSPLDFKPFPSETTTCNIKTTLSKTSPVKTSSKTSSKTSPSKSSPVKTSPIKTSPSKTTKEDIFTLDEDDDKGDLEMKLEKLEEALNVEKVSSHGIRTTRVRSLTAEIGHARRAIKMSKDKKTCKTPSRTSVSSSVVKQVNQTNVNANQTSKISRKKRKNRKSTTSCESEGTTTSSNDLELDNCMSTINSIASLPGRKTQNSIVATLNSHDIGSTINSTSQYNNATETESQQQKNTKRKKNNTKTNQSRKKIKASNGKKTKPVENGTLNKITSYFPRRIMNGSTLNDQLSPDSNSSFSSMSNPNIDASVLKTRNATRQTRKPSADASTCTPPNMFTLTAESFAKEQAIKGQSSNQIKGVKRRSNRPSGRSGKRQQAHSSSLHASDPSNPFSSSSLPQSDSFRVYRNLNSPGDSDVNSNHSSQSSGSSSLLSGSSESSSGTGSSSGSRSRSSSRTSSRLSTNRVNNSNNKSKTKRLPTPSRRTRSQSSHSDVSIDAQIPLQPNDLVWAKSPGFPWYPALVVNPEKPKTDKNGVSIPIPPDEVLNSKDREAQGSKPIYLVSFFDAKRTWQWLARDKLEPLGMDTIDKVKLTEARKVTDKKSVKAAYEKAVMFLLSLKNANLS